MKRRIIAILLAISAAASILSGCTLFEHNYERDYAQIVATVNPMTFEWKVTENGEQVTKTYVSPKLDIRKQELAEAYMNNGVSQVQQGTPQDEVVEGLLDSLINRKILVEAAKWHMKQGNLIVFNRNNSPTDDFPPKVYYDIEDSITDMNAIWKATYDVIDNQIFLIGNTMLTEQNEPERTKGENEDASTEFPVMPDFDAAELPEFEDEEEFKPQDSNPPSKDDFLYLEATARLVRTLITNAEDRFLTSEEKTRLEADKELLKEILALEDGRHYLYLRLNEFFVIEKFFLKDQIDYQLIVRLQQYITENTSVTVEEVRNQYDIMVKDQRTNYSRDISAFETALNGTDPVLYYPVGGYYYVWQILIPFTQAQTDELTRRRESGLYTTKAINDFRDQLAAGIVGRNHETGNFTGPELSYAQIYSEIFTSVNSYTDNFYREREFIRLAYKYNTDGGIFSRSMGYLVKPNGTDYVPEFQKGAMDLVTYGGVGSVEKGVGAMSEGILTDYGYHILYYCKEILPTSDNGVGLYSYETDARINRVYDQIEAKVRAQKEQENYNTFERTIFSRFKDDGKTIEKFEKRYKDMLGN